MGFFYSQIISDVIIEGGYLQLLYEPSLPLVGTEELNGTRITLCINNHCLTVDFPVVIEGASYDLSKSCSAMLWPRRIPAGRAKIQIFGPESIRDALLAVNHQIEVSIDLERLMS